MLQSEKICYYYYLLPTDINILPTKVLRVYLSELKLRVLFWYEIRIMGCVVGIVVLEIHSTTITLVLHQRLLISCHATWDNSTISSETVGVIFSQGNWPACKTWHWLRCGVL